MNKFLIAVLMLCGTAAFADTTTADQKTTAASVSESRANIDAGAVSVGCLVNCADTSQSTKDLANSAVTQAIINGQTARDVAGTTQTIRNTPSVSGPPLTSSNDTCMGSTSGSLNIAGFGVGGGTTWVDGNCKMLKNSRELWNMGMKAASIALMCSDDANREALELTGFMCPQTIRAHAKAAETAVLTESTSLKTVPSAPAATSYTDPFVRARLGLPPLK